MKRTNIKLNPNTPEYWDSVYKEEFGRGKKRFDGDRRDFLFGTIQDVWQYYPEIMNLAILDVGCGDVETLNVVHSIFPTWKKYGVDFCPDTIVRDKKYNPHIQFDCASIYKLPYRNGMFAVTFCGETIEHLDHPLDAIEELARVTMPRGNLVITVPLMNKNTSDEHMWEFEINDVIDLTAPFGKLIDIKVAAGGLSICSSTKIGVFNENKKLSEESGTMDSISWA